MKTRKTHSRLLSMLLVLVMVMAMLPTTALAAPTELDSISAKLLPGLAAGVTRKDLQACSGDYGVRTERYEIPYFSVYHGNALEDNTTEYASLDDDEKFVEGEEYTIFISFTPRDGYSISDNTPATIDGVSCKTYWYRRFEDEAIYRFVFTASAELIELESVSATLIPGLAAGVTPQALEAFTGDYGIRNPVRYDVRTLGIFEGDIPDFQDIYNEYWVEPHTGLVEGDEYTVFIKFTPRDGYSISDKTTATIEDASYKSNMCRKDVDGIIYRFLFTASAAESLYVSPFTDVPINAWYYKNVKRANQMGLINGMTPTLYAPDNNMTYAEAIKLAACMHQLYTEGEVTLVSGSSIWYSTYVDYAKENGIPCSFDDYNAAVTRAEYVNIFYYALPASDYTKINSIDALPDVNGEIYSKYGMQIHAFYEAGILAGNDRIGSFYPDNNIKRSEVAAILSRMMDKSVRVKFTLEPWGADG